MSSPIRSPRLRAALAGGGLLCLAAVPVAQSSEAAAPVVESVAAGDRAGDVVRVRVERVIASREDLGGRGLLRRLVGLDDSRLFDRPYGVAWREDDLVVTDPGRGSILLLPSRGRPSVSSSEDFVSPIGVASCGPGLVVTDSRLGRVAILDARLDVARWLATDLQRPTGVTCNDRYAFVAETARHRVVALPLAASGTADEPRPAGGGAVDWRVLGSRGSQPGRFNFPTVLDLRGDELWVGDTLNFRLQHFDTTTGRFRGAFGRLGDAPGEMPRMKGLAADGAGRLWITDAYLDQIALYRADGSLLTAFGGRGDRAGEFSFPVGLAVHPDGRVAVADSLNGRIQILRLVGPGGPR